MKKSLLLLLVPFLLGGVLLPASRGATVYANQQLMVNPFMTGDDYTGWTPTAPWRNNGASDNQVFDFTTTGPTGFFPTREGTVDIKTTGNHTSDPNFNVNTAKLTDLQFQGIFLDHAAAGDASGSLEANFFIEFDLTTASASYRAKSTVIADPWTQTPGTFLGTNGDYTWQSGGGFSGNPFSGGGLVLADITGFDVKYFMEVVTNNAGGAGTVFSTIDNASIEYAVTVVPEPTVGTLLLLGLAVLAGRRRH